MSAAEKAEEKPKNAFVAWCEHYGADPVEIETLGQYLRLDATTLKRLPIGDPAWITRLRQQAEEKRRTRNDYAARWAQQNFGPDPFRALTGKEILGILPERLRALMKRWDPKVGALIIGPTGVGKSLVSCLMGRRAIYETMLGTDRWHHEADSPESHAHDMPPTGRDERALVSNRYGVVWASASGLARARRSHPLGKGEAPFVDAAMECKLLALDDIGWEPAQDMVVADVLAERYDRGLPVIATSGEREQKLVERYGAALIRRITETAGLKGLMVDLFEDPATP